MRELANLLTCSSADGKGCVKFALQGIAAALRSSTPGLCLAYHINESDGFVRGPLTLLGKIGGAIVEGVI